MLCSLCPRSCGRERTETKGEGFCRAPERAVVARAAPHFGEEPCISGTRGSGAVFFCGCTLRCVFCQNREISRGTETGTALNDGELRAVFSSLQETGVHNLNLVTGTHFTPAILRALEGFARRIPIVWNSSGYETPQTLALLEGKIQIYLPDMKYSDPDLALRYSSAKDYPERAKEAIREMVRQTGPCVFDEDGLLKSGVLIRHLMLPGQLDNTLGVIDWVSSAFPKGTVLFSLMTQYTPPEQGLEAFPELRKRVSPLEYDAALSYMELCSLEDGYTQELSSATEELLPVFDGTGVTH